jgi:hypothetical protein
VLIAPYPTNALLELCKQPGRRIQVLHHPAIMETRFPIVSFSEGLSSSDSAHLEILGHFFACDLFRGLELTLQTTSISLKLGLEL